MGKKQKAAAPKQHTENRHTTLRGLDLSDKDLTQKELSDYDLTNTIFDRSLFMQCYILNSLLKQGSCKNMKFKECLIEATCFEQTDLTGAKFLTCRFENTSFEGTDLSNTTFDNVMVDNTTLTSMLDAGLRDLSSIMPNTSLKGINLSGCDTTTLNLQHASDVTDAVIDHTTQWTEITQPTDDAPPTLDELYQATTWRLLQIFHESQAHAANQNSTHKGKMHQLAKKHTLSTPQKILWCKDYASKHTGSKISFAWDHLQLIGMRPVTCAFLNGDRKTLWLPNVLELNQETGEPEYGDYHMLGRQLNAAGTTPDVLLEACISACIPDEEITVCGMVKAGYYATVYGSIPGASLTP